MSRNIKYYYCMFVCFLLLSASCAAPVKPPPFEVDHSDTTYNENSTEDTDCSYFYFLWGKTAELDRRYNEAVEAYEKAIVCDESSHFIIKRLAILLARLNRKQQAVYWIEKIVADRPDDVKAQMLLANFYASIGELDKATVIYKKVLDLDPKNTDTMLMLGTLYISNMEYAKAREILERLVSVDPNSSLGFQYLAKLYRELEYFDKAFSAYRKALKLHWLNSLAMEAALFYEEQGKIHSAIDLYKKMLAQDYANEAVVGRLVKVYLELGQTEKALEVLHELRKYALDPQKVDFSIGRILLDQKKYDEAIELFSSMLELYPQFELARSVLALTYYEKGEKQKAKDLLMKIPKSAAGYDEALAMLIKIMRDEKEYDEAITLIGSVLDDKSQTASPEIYALLASVYQEKGDLDAAFHTFDEAIAKYPDESDLYFEYGMFLDRAGRMDEAMVQIETVLELEPENPYALNYIGYTWAEKGEKLNQALVYIKKATLLKPQDGFIRDSLGWVYFKLGNTLMAIQELEKAASLVQDDPTIYEHLGEAYEADNRSYKAIQNYRKSLEFYEEQKDKDRVLKRIQSLR